MTVIRQLGADWRRATYCIPITFCLALVVVSVTRWLLHLFGWQKAGGIFSGSLLLAVSAILYFVMLEIPGRKLIIRPDSITMASWRGSRTIPWASVADVQPGAGGWMNVNRQLPAAARLVLGQTAEIVAVPDVFHPRRRQLFDAVRSAWLASRSPAG